MADVKGETERAGRAAARSSRWHQGSGIQADMYAGMAEAHEEAAAADPARAEEHAAAAALWADAAEADADYLDRTGGSWDDDEGWAAAVRPAALKAAEASRALGMEMAEDELGVS